MPGESSRNNCKKGGRPPGSKNPETLQKERVLAEIRQRILQSADTLFNAAKSAAIGNQFLFKIVTETVGKKKFRSKPILVADPVEIAAYIDQLDKDINTGIPSGSEDDDVYYFISTKEPNIQAYRELMDRAFGKSTEKVDITSGGREITGVVINPPKLKK